MVGEGHNRWFDVIGDAQPNAERCVSTCKPQEESGLQVTRQGMIETGRRMTGFQVESTCRIFVLTIECKPRHAMTV
jgi:hypothetical protein